jgi:hypothetical protein
MGRMGMSTTEYSGETRWRRRRSSTTIGEGGEDDDDDDLAEEVGRGASIRSGIILGDVWKEAPD